jgi:hypothetical protein
MHYFRPWLLSSYDSFMIKSGDEHGTAKLPDLPSAATAQLKADNRVCPARGSGAKRMDRTEERGWHSDGRHVPAMSDRPVEEPDYPRAQWCLDGQLRLPITRRELIARANHLSLENCSARLLPDENAGWNRALRAPEAIAQCWRVPHRKRVASTACSYA